MPNASTWVRVRVYAPPGMQPVRVRVYAPPGTQPCDYAALLEVDDATILRLVEGITVSSVLSFVHQA